MTSRKKPGVAFWTTVALVVVLVYPLSIGPAYWATSHFASPRFWSIADFAYRPVAIVCGKSEIATRAVFWYTDQWHPKRRNGINLAPGFELELEATSM